MARHVDTAGSPRHPLHPRWPLLPCRSVLSQVGDWVEFVGWAEEKVDVPGVAALSPWPLTPSPAPPSAPAAFPPLSWAESAAALIDPSPAPTSAPATSPLLGRIELAAAPVDSLPPPTSSPAASPPLGRAESAAASVDTPPLGQPKLPAAVSASPATRPAPS
ncbi:hypothetical protein DAI22_06g153900 [Oryza sativa Japonica Group]|nr:hypothetical protein DAI22_06g153900 [Oryza sativa Japonica Group]